MEKLDKLKSILGDPFYSNDSTLIYNMDCLEGIKILKNAGVNIDANT